MVLSDFDLKTYIKRRRLRILKYNPETVRENGIDFRFSNEWSLLRETDLVYDLHDPPKDKNEFYKPVKSPSFVLNRGETVLASTLEYMYLPDDIMGFCELRSTYARLGISIPPTIIDATWHGNLTIQLTATRFPVKLHKRDRFLHAIFARLTSPVDVPYRGKYQGQKGVAMPIPDPKYREVPSR